MSSRLFQGVREERGLVYSVYSFHSAFLDGGRFGIYAGTGSREVRELVPVVCGELAKLTEGVSSEELERARAQLRASMLMSRESSRPRAEHIPPQPLSHGREVPVEAILAKIAALTVGDIQSVARRVSAPGPAVTAVGPPKTTERAQPDARP